MIKLLILLFVISSCKEKERKSSFMLVNLKVIEQCQNKHLVKVKTDRALLEIKKSIFVNLNNVFFEDNPYSMNFYVDVNNKTFIEKITFKKENKEQEVKLNNEVRIKRLVGKMNEIKINCD